MCDIAKLKGKIAEKGLKQTQLAKMINMDRTTLSRKLRTGEDFSIKEAEKIALVLNLSCKDAINIFFDHIVA